MPPPALAWSIETQPPDHCPMLPPIRYPLPTLLALALASLMAWQGLALSTAWRAEIAARLKLGLEGPPVPSSTRPKVVAGPITRRALLLRDATIARTRPNGPEAETIDRRMFVDIYDTWPSPGPVSHVRVGNRKAIGWVEVGDVLPWDTRLVIRPPGGKLDLADSPGEPARTIEVGNVAMPVLSWTEKAVEVAVWEADRPWSAVARRGWAAWSDLPPEAWGVWISQVELPTLLGLANQGDAWLVARIRAVAGRLAEGRPWTPGDAEAARPAFPVFMFDRPADPSGAAGRLAEANARPLVEAAWSGLSFRTLPLADLP